jgi:hypothetical protein
MSQSAKHGHDSPEVAAFRKKARGEPLTAEEERLLTSATRKPAPGATVPHSQVEAMLEERRRRERG